MSDPVALYTRILASLRGGDDAATLRFFAPDFAIHEDPGMPYGGELIGGEAFLALFRKVYATWGEQCLELLFKCGDPEGGHAAGIFKLTGRPGMAPIESFVTVVWTFRDELAAEVRIFYYDTPRLAEALAASGWSDEGG
jgi:ketosteroid isomerase-like protein